MMLGICIEPDFEQKYKLGTRKIDKLGHLSKYAKIDFGIVGYALETGGEYRSVCYTWIRTKI